MQHPARLHNRGRFGALWDDDGGAGGEGGAVGPDEGLGTTAADQAAAAANAAAATASAQASGAGTGASGGGQAGAAAQFDPSLGIGIPGVDPQAQTLADALGAQGADAETFGLGPPGLFNDPITGNPVSAAELGARGAFSALSFGLGAPMALGIPGVLGTFANAFGATPGTDVDAFGASIGDVGTTGAGGAAGGSQGVGGGAVNEPQFLAGAPVSLADFVAPPSSGTSAPPLGFPAAPPIAQIPNIVFPDIPPDQLAAFQQRLNRFRS